MSGYVFSLMLADTDMQLKFMSNKTKIQNILIH